MLKMYMFVKDVTRWSCVSNIF